MAATSNVTYSGLNNQNVQRVSDIQMAESTVAAYYNSLGGDTKRKSHWHVDNNGNVSHTAYVQREDKLNEKLRAEAEENARELIEKTREKARAEYEKSISSNTAVYRDGVSYEKTISDSVLAGLEYIQALEKEISGTKFFVGSVSYGQTYGNFIDINFVVNLDFLDKLGTDENIQKQYEEDVKYLADFSKRMRENATVNGREIVNQGWFCDENGNWGGWSVSVEINQNFVLQEMADNAERIRQEALAEQKEIEQELKEHFGERFKGFYVKWMEEDIKPEEMAGVENSENTSEEESTTVSGSIGVNVGKTARKIAAAKTTSQLRMVIAEIKGDMQEVKDGMEKGMCDESELAKVELLMSMAQNRMGQVDNREATPEEEQAFALASLM
ncbi:MAG: hypothetical protein E7262_03780 [Lachnospiraceae bacterium]|nr:hypothetical protein [Lachnospiraceae bacterium]